MTFGPLRSTLTLLVLLNLVFVQITGAVGTAWSSLLFGATLAAPLLRRHAGSRWWRTAWNVAVVAVFGVLVARTLDFGPRYLLEDGLTLAAFCQVHLLHVIQKGQKPDLLFFNSFLIALVTSFFCQDLTFSVVFCFWALVFAVALQLAAVAHAGEVDAREISTITRAGLLRGMCVLVATGAVFTAWPRDFERPGLVDERLIASAFSRERRAPADRMVLGRSAHVTLSDRVVLRIERLGDGPVGVPSHWRTSTLDLYDERGWRRGDARPGAPRHWQPSGKDGLGRAGESPTGRAIVTIADPALGRLPAPLTAVELRLGAEVVRELVDPRLDATLAYRGRLGRGGNSPASYTLGWRDGAAPAEDDAPDSERWLRLPPVGSAAVPLAVQDALTRALGGLPATASQAVVVERCRAWLEDRIPYLLPGEQGAARRLDEFLGEAAGGHCEYFATALALMLRLRGIPCRLATGYLAREWDADQRVLTVRERHAHAWVEVLGTDGVWRTVDATPAGGSDAAAQTGGLLGAAVRRLERLWRSVTTFDSDDRRALFAALRALPGRVGRSIAEHPFAALVALALLLAGGARLRRARRRDAAIVTYERTLRGLRLRRGPTETPRELLERVGDTLEEPRRRRLAQATLAHETARYGA